MTVLLLEGGVAGLTAGIYLSRYCFKTCIIDGQQSRASFISCTHNFPGFPDGISGKEILQRLTNQYKIFKQKLKFDTVVSIMQTYNLFKVKTRKESLYSKTIIIATGVVDKEPNIPHLKNAIQRGLIRHCLICDGYEARNKRIIVIGADKKSLRQAYLLKTYSNKITLINIGNLFFLNKKEKQQLYKSNIEIVHDNIQAIQLKKRNTKIYTNRQIHECDIIYSALGVNPRSDIAIALGINHNREKLLITNSHQETNIKFSYAVGDVSTGINQMTTAAASAIIASTHIFNKLRGFQRS